MTGITDQYNVGGSRVELIIISTTSQVNISVLSNVSFDQYFPGQAMVQYSFSRQAW